MPAGKQILDRNRSIIYFLVGTISPFLLLTISEFLYQYYDIKFGNIKGGNDLVWIALLFLFSAPFFFFSTYKYNYWKRIMITIFSTLIAIFIGFFFALIVLGGK